MINRIVFLLLLVSLSALAQESNPGWIARSNENAKLLLDVYARYAPEESGELGVEGLDEKISMPLPGRQEQRRRDLTAAIGVLQSRLATEKDRLVKQDLEILIAAGKRDVESSATSERLLLPYRNVAGTVFYGIHALLADQVAPERRKAAIVRLKRYAGMEPGYTATTILAEQRFREKEKQPGLLGPSRQEVEKDLNDADSLINGVGLLLEKYKMHGYEAAYARFKSEMADYQQFVRQEVLPRCRTDFRLPPELYKQNLENAGVDFPIEELQRRAHQSFLQIQAEMKPLAAKIAAEQHLPSADYRDVIKALKKNQLNASDIMPRYHECLAEIEAIIRREHLLTLPNRPAIIRLASAAETAQQPAPHMRPPPLLNNHGERGQFVLPAGTSGANGTSLKYDDFTFAAATWTLTAHEARPGHELQFATMVEHGVSEARAIFAFNSTNVEGWGLYSEWMMLPYMPDEGKLVSLQLRLLRAARAFMDPELQQGKITPQQAMSILENDVVLSKAFATEEVDRFTFRMPGQAVSYFDGYLRLREIRDAAQSALGPKFNVQRFHDFVLLQGMLPPSLLRKAVMTEFVPKELRS